MKYSSICLKGGGREFLLPQAQLLRSGEKLKRHAILLLLFLCYEVGCQCEKRIIEQDANVDVGVMICVSSLSLSLFSFFFSVFQLSISTHSESIQQELIACRFVNLFWQSFQVHVLPLPFTSFATARSTSSAFLA